MWKLESKLAIHNRFIEFLQSFQHKNLLGGREYGSIHQNSCHR